MSAIATPEDARHHEGSVAACLQSRRSLDRLLLVVVDLASARIDVKLFDDELLARGEADCTLRMPEPGSATVQARVALAHERGEFAPGEVSEASLAITWALLDEGGVRGLDVAGAAYVFHPAGLYPEEFRARRRDPFNTFDSPEVAGPDESPSGTPADAPLKRPRRQRGWSPPVRLPLPQLGPRRRRWALLSGAATLRGRVGRATTEAPTRGALGFKRLLARWR